MGNGLDLETVIRGLHSSEIRVGLQTFSEGIMVWVSDRLHRIRAEPVFDNANPLTIEDSVARRAPDLSGDVTSHCEGIGAVHVGWAKAWP